MKIVPKNLLMHEIGEFEKHLRLFPDFRLKQLWALDLKGKRLGEEK